MSNFPSWFETENGPIYLTDRDIKDNEILSSDWNDAVGHTAIRKVYPNIMGERKEGFKICPDSFWQDILSGKCQKMMEATDLLNFSGRRPDNVIIPQKIHGSLILDDCDLKDIVLPQEIGFWLVLYRCRLNDMVWPQKINKGINVTNCNLKGAEFPPVVEGNLYMAECDLRDVILPKVGGWFQHHRCINVGKIDYVEKAIK